MASRDTIFALASAPGRAGVAVIRVSGPLAYAALRAMTGEHVPKARRAVVRRLSGTDGQQIDEGLVLWFPGPHSYTGEDCGELHIHGGRAIIAGIFETLRAIGLRPAAAGEFTRRAVENGRLDLTRAEAIADLVQAETPAQRRQALRQFEGSLADLYERWRDQLVQAAAWAEAAIDFEDEDLPADALPRARAQVVELSNEIRMHLSDSRRGELVRDGIHLTVIGPPNTGKSTLINTLARRDVAIVSEVAGTTRDIIEVRLNLGGYEVIVADTAGLRETVDAVEAEGVRRALRRAQDADLTLLLLDGSAVDPAAGVSRETVETASLVVLNKMDLPAAGAAAPAGPRISLKTGEGVADLLDRLANLVRRQLENPSDVPVLTRARHRHALESALAALDRAGTANSPELFAEDLRLALRSVGHITGAVDVEQLLDVVFRDFCIGK